MPKAAARPGVGLGGRGRSTAAFAWLEDAPPVLAVVVFRCVEGPRSLPAYFKAGGRPPTGGAWPPLGRPFSSSRFCADCLLTRLRFFGNGLGARLSWPGSRPVSYCECGPGRRSSSWLRCPRPARAFLSRCALSSERAASAFASSLTAPTRLLGMSSRCCETDQFFS